MATMIRVMLLGLALFGASPAVAGLDRFTPVPEPADYPAGVALSPRYHVMVKLASDPSPWDAIRHATATYRLWPDYLDPETLPAKHSRTAVHVAQVDSDVRIRVRVELVDGTTIQTLRLKPTRLSEMLSSQLSGSSWVEFEADPYAFTRHILVEINAPVDDADALQDGLMFFLNPPSRIPEGKVLILPPGVIDETSPYLDERNRLLIDQTSEYDALYIPQNTLIDGRVDIRKAGFSVSGRGMIIGSRWPFAKAVPDWRKRYPSWISPTGEEVKPLLSFKQPRGTEDTSSHFEGVLVAHPYHFCVGWAYQNDNLKTFGWRFSSDGIHGVHKRGSFMRVNDDAVYINVGSVEDCTFWGMVNGACLQLGWGLGHDNDTPVHVRRVDIVRGEWDILPNPGVDGVGAPANVIPADELNAGSNRAVLAGTFRNAEAHFVRNKFFEDVRVDFRANRLFCLGSRTEEVSYENFVFRDIRFEKQPSYEGVLNILRGKDGVRGFVFENFVIEGRKAGSLEDFEPLARRNVEGVEFR